MDYTHRFIPAPQSLPARVLLLLHGTGGNEDDMIPLGRDLDSAAALLSPRGQRSRERDAAVFPAPG